LSADFDTRGAAQNQQVRDRVWDCMDAARLLIDEDGDRRVDSDADPLDLVCALTLVRVASHTLATGSVRAGRDWCAVNPLHGAAAGKAPFTVPGFAKTDKAPVCGGCRYQAAPGDASGWIGKRMLRLPSTGGRGPAVRYDELDGPVRLFGSHTNRLVADIREYLGVQ
jgi:hypothetical protein